MNQDREPIGGDDGQGFGGGAAPQGGGDLGGSAAGVNGGDLGGYGGGAGGRDLGGPPADDGGDRPSDEEMRGEPGTGHGGNASTDHHRHTQGAAGHAGSAETRGNAGDGLRDGPDGDAGLASNDIGGGGTSGLGDEDVFTGRLGYDAGTGSNAGGGTATGGAITPPNRDDDPRG